MIDIDRLLALDTRDPSSALEFRIGVARLAGWTQVEEYRDGTWLGRNPMADNQLLPVIEYERSVDAALTLPLQDGYVIELHYPLPHAEANIWHRGYEVEEVPFFYKADKPAEAVSKSWLRYRAAQSAPVATADEEAHG